MGNGSFARDATYRLFVSNMSAQTTEDRLRALVGQFGAVAKVSLAKVVSKDESRGFAFVEMTDEQALYRAITALNGTEIDGRCLKVRLGF
jgi:RNA recognition motif-containing protein